MLRLGSALALCGLALLPTPARAELKLFARHSPPSAEFSAQLGQLKAKTVSLSRFMAQPRLVSLDLVKKKGLVVETGVGLDGQLLHVDLGTTPDQKYALVFNDSQSLVLAPRVRGARPKGAKLVAFDNREGGIVGWVATRMTSRGRRLLQQYFDNPQGIEMLKAAVQALDKSESALRREHDRLVQQYKRTDYMTFPLHARGVYGFE